MTQDRQQFSEIVDKILCEGAYFIFDDFAGKAAAYDAVTKAILSGIEKIEGPQVRRRVEGEGLAKMHEHLSPDKIFYLQRYLQKTIGQRLIKLACEFGRDRLGLTSEFFIDKVIPMRIHFPFEVSRKAKLRRDEYLRASFIPLNQRLRREFQKWWKRGSDLDSKATYHSNLPVAAWAHGPHLDTWFGHSFDGINLWWAIAGATEDAGVILYPETFGMDFNHHDAPPYLAPGTALPKPHKMAVPDRGVLCFNSEMLHGTQLNVSDLTRVVISIRINPGKPTFSKESTERDYVEWYSSEDVANDRHYRLREFPRAKNIGKSIKTVKVTAFEKRLFVRTSEPLLHDVPLRLCPSENLPIDKKVLVSTPNEEVVVARLPEGLRAFHARCPHVGINLIDGYHDDSRIYCPGHGVAYDLLTGKSKCPSLKLRMYTAYDEDGYIYLKI